MDKGNLTGILCYFLIYLPHKSVDHIQDPVFVVGTCDEICGFFDNRLGVLHCDAESGIFDHGKVVVAVAAADHFISGKSDTA